MKGKIQTVLGPIEPAALGMTITHEHLLMQAGHVSKEPTDQAAKLLYGLPVDLQILGKLRFGRVVNHDNCRLDSIETAIEEVARFKLAGGGTIVDATSIGIGRDPLSLSQVSAATGINVIMGSSYYVEETLPPELGIANLAEEQIAETITEDILSGVGETGIRAGMIGEVGCSWPLTALERRVLRASVRAQRATGAPLMIHPGRDQRAPMEIIALIERAGADLSRTILCHIDRTIDQPDLLSRLAATGCILEYDLFGSEHSYYPWTLPIDMPNDAGRLRWLRWLFEQGYGEQVVISHDICFKDKLARYGGHGYGHILENVVPLMRSKGFGSEEIELILINTPQRLFSFV